MSDEKKLEQQIQEEQKKDNQKKNQEELAREREKKRYLNDIAVEDDDKHVNDDDEVKLDLTTPVNNTVDQESDDEAMKRVIFRFQVAGVILTAGVVALFCLSFTASGVVRGTTFFSAAMLLSVPTMFVWAIVKACKEPAEADNSLDSGIIGNHNASMPKNDHKNNDVQLKPPNSLSVEKTLVLKYDGEAININDNAKVIGINDNAKDTSNIVGNRNTVNSTN